MTGYLMNFFKYAAIDKDNFEDDDTMYLNAHEGEVFVRSVVWSVFDRIEIREIDSFQKFRLSQYSEKKWVGERQFTLLYEINSGKKNLNFKKNNDKCRFAFHKAYDSEVTEEEQEIDERKYRFFGISMIDLMPEVHYDFYSQDNSGKVMHDVMREIVDNLCEKNSVSEDKICYELYGTLGENDLVIVWLANEYSDVMTIIEALRMSKIKKTNKSIVANVATIMGLRDINNPHILYDDVKGHLNIRFTKKGTYDHEVFKKELKEFLDYNELEFDTTLGEHDLSLKVSGIELSKKLYNDSGFIHIRNQTFFDNIIQANTEVSVNIEYQNLKTCEYKLKKNFSRAVVSLQEKEDVYKNIEDIVKNDIFMDLPYLKETLWILYEDYLKDISSSLSYPWINDLHFQFSQSIVYLKQLVNLSEDKVSRDAKYKIMRELISTMRQTILHVSQANRLFFEIPNTHLRNTGSYSKVLRTYYGVVKQLLAQAYSIPKREQQSVIIPFITFDVIPKITSMLLPQLGSESAILNIVLPYEALVDIPKYSKLLAHEVFHYISPRSRENRNTIVGIICITSFISQVMFKYLLNEMENDKESEVKENTIKAYRDSINEHCMSYVINFFEGVVGYIENYNSSAEWDTYFESLENIYSSRSIKFSTLDKLHKEIFYIFQNVKEVFKKEDKGEFKTVNNILDSMTYQKFVDWIQAGGYQSITKINDEVKYALREVAADYFMLQVMDKDVREKCYYDLNLHYKKLLADPSRDKQQLYRMGIITDYLFKDITSKLSESGNNEVYKELVSKINGLLCNEEKTQHVMQCFLLYRETLKQYRKLIFMYMEELNFEKIKSRDFAKKLEETRELMDESEIDDFQKSVQYVERFQMQENLENISVFLKVDNNRQEYILNTMRKSIDIKAISLINEEQNGFYAWNVESLIKCLDSAASQVSDGEEIVWFRGHSSYKYNLLPTLYRMKDKKELFYKSVSLRDVMEPLFKSFKVKAFGAKEIFQGGDNSRIGILASMQHYSVPTNILDWTPSAFVALYFAVEEYMTLSEKDKNERKKPKEDAEVWILNPIRLNVARVKLTARRIDEGEIEGYPIPSIYEDEEEYKEYIPFSKQKQPYNLPIAVYVPHINQRIKAQLGTFTMFSLDSKGTPDEKGDSVVFEDLQKIQDRYKKDCKDGEYKPFLVNVRISKSCIIQVADWLRRMGISKPSIYPELKNVSEALTGEIRDYWEKKENDIV